MPLKGKKVIVTGGPTREWLDPVRFISNPSSGRMGIALADAAYERGAEVIFIHGPVDENLLKDKKYLAQKVESTSDMLRAVTSSLTMDSILLMAAAPADYTPVTVSETKIKKSEDKLVLRLKKTPDILKEVAKLRSAGTFKGITAGFAAETHDIETYALGKLKDKNLDMICLNDVSREGAGFSAETNIITIFKRDGTRIDLPMMSKREAAERILDEIEKILNKHNS